MAHLPCLSAAAAALDRAAAPAADDGDDRGKVAVGHSDLLAADRTGQGGDKLAVAAAEQLDAVLSRLKTADDQRFVKLGAAARTQAEYFAAGITRAGDAQLEAARRAALLAAGFKGDLVNDQRCAILRAGAGVVGLIAADGMHPAAVRAAVMCTVNAAIVPAAAAASPVAAVIAPATVVPDRSAAAAVVRGAGRRSAAIGQAGAGIHAICHKWHLRR